MKNTLKALVALVCFALNLVILNPIVVLAATEKPVPSQAPIDAPLASTAFTVPLGVEVFTVQAAEPTL